MKKKRQTKILELIKTNNICRQEELTQLLNQSGIIATQATVSRDIKELRLLKTLDKTGKYRYTLPEEKTSTGLDHQKYYTIIENGVRTIDYAVNLVVVKCHPGLAMAVCTAIDALNYENILGTLPGDDTIFIAARTEDAAKKIADEIALILK